MRDSMLSLSWPFDDSRTRLWAGSSADGSGRGYVRREGVRSLLVEHGQWAGYDVLANVVTYFRRI